VRRQAPLSLTCVPGARRAQQGVRNLASAGFKQCLNGRWAHTDRLNASTQGGGQQLGQASAWSGHA
jgi:hypothetical protein